MNKYNVDIESLEATIKSRYPTIIARSYGLFLSEPDPRNRLVSLIQCVFQNILRHVALISLSEYCEQECSLQKLNEMISQLQRPSYGHWAQFLRMTNDHFSKTPPQMVHELASIYTPKKHRKLKIDFMVNTLINIKNKKFSHGCGLPSVEESESLLAIHHPEVNAWLDELDWMCDYPLFARHPDGSLLKLVGHMPTNLGSTNMGGDLESFLSNGQKILPAFPFFLNLWNARDNSSANLFLFNGASQKRIHYLSHTTHYEEKSTEVVETLRNKFQNKAIQLRETCSELTGENIHKESLEQTERTLKNLSTSGRFNSKLYVPRATVDSAFNYWLESRGKGSEVEGAKPAIILSGSAGSGKSMALYSLAESMLKGPHAAVLVLARELCGSKLEDLESEIERACLRPEPLETILATLCGEENSNLYVIIDAVDESSAPSELLLSVIALLDKHSDYGLRVALTVRDVVLGSMTQDHGFCKLLEMSRKHFLHFEKEEGGKKISRPYLVIPRINDEEFEIFFKQYIQEYDISISELDENSRQVLQNPFMLRLVCESFSGHSLPPHITAHKVFDNYLRVKLTNQFTGEIDRESKNLLQRLVQSFLDHRVTQLDEDLLYDDLQLGTYIRNNDFNSPFNRLLNEAILVRIQEDKDTPFSSVWIRVNFDHLLEVLMLGLFEKREFECLLAEIEKKPVFRPLEGVLTLWLTKAAETKNIQPFARIAKKIADEDLNCATLRALEEISYTDFPFVTSVVETLADTGEPSAFECILKLVNSCSSSGRWLLSDELLNAINKTKGAKSEACSILIQRIELIYARDVFKRGEDEKKALGIFRRLTKSSDACVRVEALQGEILVYDSYDTNAYLKASQKCLSLAEKTENPDLKVFSLWSIGGYYEYQNKYQQAIAYYQQVFDMELEYEGKVPLGMRPYSEDLSPIYLWMGRALSGIPGRATEAESYYLKALEMDLKAGRLYQISVDWNNLSIFYLEILGNVQLALKYSEKELSQEHLFPSDPEWACSYFFRSCLMLMIGKWDEAAKSATKSVEIGESSEGHNNYLAHGYFALFCTSIGRGEMNEAKIILSKLVNLNVAVEPDPELELFIQATTLAFSLLGDTSAGSVKAEVLLKEAQEHNLTIRGCNCVGLILLAIDRIDPTRTHSEDLIALASVATTIGNRYWIEFSTEREKSKCGGEQNTISMSPNQPNNPSSLTREERHLYVRPPKLKPGDRVAIIAPSSPVDSIQIRAGMKVLQEQGLVPVLGENIRFIRSKGLYAAPIEDRIRECVSAFTDPTIAAIIVGTGGFGCAQILPFLPYEKIRKNPKILMGFSDVTALNAGLLTHSGLVSFNGPSASIRYDTEENAETDSVALRDAIGLLMCDQPWDEKPFCRNKMLPRCISPGSAIGTVIGGNLTTLACLMGTPYFPDVTGAILFLEDVDEGGYELARTLSHLQLGGVLDKIAGVVIGEFSRVPEQVDPGDPSIEEVLFDFFGNGPPCVAGFNFSHGETGAILPFGGTVRLNAEACTIEFYSPFL